MCKLYDSKLYLNKIIWETKQNKQAKTPIRWKKMKGLAK